MGLSEKANHLGLSQEKQESQHATPFFKDESLGENPSRCQVKIELTPSDL
jgi:hypothetical protein